MKKSTAMVEFQKNRKDISRQKVENTIRPLINDFLRKMAKFRYQ